MFKAGSFYQAVRCAAWKQTQSHVGAIIFIEVLLVMMRNDDDKGRYKHEGDQQGRHTMEEQHIT